ncbi:hypothetical protein [Dubosiella newyorkensis]|nr:hypothetical protein [Dubosiella newyorkensis]
MIDHRPLIGEVVDLSVPETFEPENDVIFRECRFLELFPYDLVFQQ